MIKTPKTLYVSNSHDLAIFLDLRLPGVGKCFSRERMAPRRQMDTTILHLGSRVPIVRPGVSSELPR